MLNTTKTSNRKKQSAREQERLAEEPQKKSLGNQKSDLIAYDVRNVPGREKGIWSRVGAVWMHKDGKGADVLLNALPMSGRIVLRERIEKPDQDFDNHQY